MAQTGSLTISDSSECVSISIQSDSVSEPGLECLLVTFSTTDTGFTLQSPGIATICIRDGESVQDVCPSSYFNHEISTSKTFGCHNLLLTCKNLICGKSYSSLV